MNIHFFLCSIQTNIRFNALTVLNKGDRSKRKNRKRFYEDMKREFKNKKMDLENKRKKKKK